MNTVGLMSLKKPEIGLMSRLQYVSDIVLPSDAGIERINPAGVPGSR